MDFYYSPIALLFILATVLQLLLLIYVFSHSRTSLSEPVVRTLAYVLLAGTLWSGPYALQLMAVDLSSKLFWFKLEHIGPMLLLPALLLHIATYTGHYSWFTRRRLALLGIEPLITTLLLLSNEYHSLLWSDPTIVTVGSTRAFYRTVGPWWYFRITYQYLLAAVIIVLLVNAYRSSKGPIRKQIRLLFVGFSVPFVVGILFDVQYLLELVALDALADIEFIGAALGVSGVVLSYSLVRHRYLDLAPIGRQVAIERLVDPYAVIDARRRIVDANAAFSQLTLHEGTPIGETVTDVVPELESVLDRSGDIARTELTLANPDGRWFDVQLVQLPRRNLSSLRKLLYFDGNSRRSDASAMDGGDTTDSIQGTVVLFRDVTEQKEHRQTLEAQTERLEMLNQLIRHDIRNEISLSMSVLRRLDTEVPESTRPHVDTLRESVNRVVSITEDAQALTDAISELPEELSPVSLSDVLERETANATLLSSSATVRIDGELPDVTVQANELLSSVFANLIGNAVEHNDSAHPEVVVSVSETADDVTVRIQDNGPGIPDEHKGSVFDQGWTGADSDGTGFGLYFVEQVCAQCGGWVDVRDNGAGGTTVAVTLARYRAQGPAGSHAPTSR